jgi:hypothetical protein
MSTTPQQQSRILYINDDEPNTVVPNVSVASTGVNSWNSYGKSDDKTDLFNILFGCDFSWNHPASWISTIIMFIGTVLAINISWKTNIQSDTFLRVIFAGTAGFFNYVYIILHYIFQTTTTKSFL